jgi:ubiquinone/menaquinone biosynthesis C-methylase UbiE
MIKRTSREHVLKILENNQNNWKILDIGCNRDAVKYAQTVADIQNLSSFYEDKDKNFVLIQNKDLPFKDNQFDFVYASHVIEHVEDVSYFIKELQRISKQGYIELPSMLEDNIVLSENNIKDHKWFFQFDDVKNVLLTERKRQLIEPFITHGVLFESLRKNFRSSLVLELLWENEINYEFKKFTVESKKPYFISIIKKYFSYLIRTNKVISVLTLAILIFLIIKFI